MLQARLGELPASLLSRRAAAGKNEGSANRLPPYFGVKEPLPIVRAVSAPDDHRWLSISGLHAHPKMPVAAPRAASHSVAPFEGGGGVPAASASSSPATCC